MDQVFGVSSLLVLPFWVLMILLPRARVTQRLMETWVGPVVPALVYVVMALPHLGAFLPTLLRPDRPAVTALLSSPEGTTLAWAHYLAFDLFVGRWAYLDSRERGLSPALMAPVLLMVFMVGPVGLVGYLLLRALAQPRPAIHGGA